MSIGWTAVQLRAMQARAQEAGKPPRHFNPKPAGSIQQGSYTHRALLALRGARGAWVGYSELLVLMGECKDNPPSIHWALALLIRRVDAECSNNDSRNPRYAMYRAVMDSHE